MRGKGARAAEDEGSFFSETWRMDVVPRAAQLRRSTKREAMQGRGMECARYAKRNATLLTSCLRRQFVSQEMPTSLSGWFSQSNKVMARPRRVVAHITQTNVVVSQRGGASMPPSNTCVDSQVFPCLLEKHYFARDIEAGSGWRMHHRYDLPWRLVVAHSHYTCRSGLEQNMVELEVIALGPFSESRCESMIGML